jgi:hypothetical protein
MSGMLALARSRQVDKHLAIGHNMLYDIHAKTTVIIAWLCFGQARLKAADPGLAGCASNSNLQQRGIL